MHAELRYYFSSNCPLKVRIYFKGYQIERVKLEKSSRNQLECYLYKDKNPTSKKSIEITTKILCWLRAYFLGKEPKETLPFKPFSSEFSKSVLETLMKTQAGETLTYKQLGELIHKPNAQRAVGGALHRNPYPLFIPCHRVVAQKSVGGFAYPIEIKKLLLEFEKTQEQLSSTSAN